MKRTKPTKEEGQRALRGHVLEKANATREKYGGPVDYSTMLTILEDREVVRYPTRIVFDATPLSDGLFAKVEPTGSNPTDGFCLFVHPRFEGRQDVLPLLIAYHLVRVNYGEIVTHEEAELFGATLLQLDVEAYYETLCRLADECG